MARGRTLATYHTDLYFAPPNINVDVPDNLFSQAALGWTAATPNAPRGNKRFKERHAVGVDATGKRVRVTVADPGADLWTGVATTWNFIANDGSAQTATVTGLVGEAGTV